MKKYYLKKLLSLCLSMTMLISFAPQAVFADGGTDIPTKTGRVVRAVNTLYNASNGIDVQDYKAVSGATVNMFGIDVITDSQGNFSLEVPNDFKFEYTDASVTADGETYTAQVSVSVPSEIRLPAFKTFNVDSISAKYEESENINSAYIPVEDKMLELSVALSFNTDGQSGNASFFVTDFSGDIIVACDEDDNYITANEQSEGQLVATLKFNPKNIMDFNKKIYIQLIDGNGNQYDPIDLGYTFFSKVDLGEFVFPNIGSSSIEELYRSGQTYDIIGDPLSDIKLGVVSNFDFSYDKHYDDSDGSEYSSTKYELGKSGKTKPSWYETNNRLKWPITPDVGFDITISHKNRKNYFENLSLAFNDNFNSKTQNKAELPIGIDIASDMILSGDTAGKYEMYVDHSTQDESADDVEYTSESFGMFKDCDGNVQRYGYMEINPTISAMLANETGIATVTGYANFDYDMDFQFDGEIVNAYGDITQNLDLNIDVLGFSIYNKNIAGETFTLFNSYGTGEHIDFSAEKEDSAENMLRGKKEQHQADASENTKEVTIKTGMFINPKAKIARINNSEYLAIFIDENPSREGVNKRTLYYSIFDGNSASNPVIINDDGTLDDYPQIQDLGNGQLLITWSSADKIFEETADLTDVLSSMNVQAVFFDKATKEFGEASTLTKTTSKDYAADMMARASYDEETDRLIIYYSKTLYSGYSEASDLYDEINAPSTFAYLLYENGKWQNNGDVYSDEELVGFDEEEKVNYKKEWYGQRFLDLRHDIQSPELLRVVEYDAIADSGKSFFAYIVDWDRNLKTIDDRDIFIKLYDFEKNTFTDLEDIHITSEGAYYATPKFVCVEDETYLFFGAQDTESGKGEIRYVNVTGGDINGDAEFAVSCNNSGDFDVFTDENQNIYLVWTEISGGARKVFASMLSETGSGQTVWSEPVVLTANEANTYYLGSGANAINGNIYVWAQKANYRDESNKNLCMVKHQPFAKAEVTDISLSDEHPMPGSVTEAEVTVTNQGLLPLDGGVNVTLCVNGENMEETYTEVIPGGASAKVIFQIQIPEEEAATIEAFVGEEDSYPPLNVEYKSIITVTDEEIVSKNGEYVFTANIKNTENAASEPIMFTAYTGSDLIGTCESEAIKAGCSSKISVPLRLTDDAFILIEGTGVADISISAVQNQKTIYKYNKEVKKEYNKDAVALIQGLTAVTFENNGSYSANKRQQLEIQPEFEGAAEDSLMVQWLTSSDDTVATIKENKISTLKSGTVTLTGVVVPNSEIISLEKGTAERVDWANCIPHTLSNVTINLEVNSGGGGGGGLSTTTTTTKNEDGSTTKTTENKSTGTKTETTTYPDGSSQKVETQKDGTVTTTQEDKDGNTTTTVENPDGTTITTEKNKDGSEKVTEEKADGTTVTTEKEADGTKTVTTENADGSKTIEETKKDGTKVTTKTTTDGETTAKIDVQEGKETEVTIPVSNADDVTKVTVTDKDGNVTEITDFEITEDGVKISVSGDCEVVIGKAAKKEFSDVHPVNHWSMADVDYVYAKGLMNGTSENEFSPDGKLTRAMLVTVLWRMENEPVVNYLMTFEDVENETYYTEAVRWAASEKIINGYSETEFAPNENITREQIAAIMHRYATYKGYDVSVGENANILPYDDFDSISEYAISSMQYVVGNGLMKGKTESTLNPKDNATRAEIAAILHRFIEATK